MQNQQWTIPVIILNQRINTHQTGNVLNVKMIEANMAGIATDQSNRIRQQNRIGRSIGQWIQRRMRNVTRRGGGENVRIEGISLNGASLQSRNCKLINDEENNALTDNREA
jgi:hypothetical protein